MRTVIALNILIADVSTKNHYNISEYIITVKLAISFSSREILFKELDQLRKPLYASLFLEIQTGNTNRYAQGANKLCSLLLFRHQVRSGERTIHVDDSPPNTLEVYLSLDVVVKSHSVSRYIANNEANLSGVFD